MKMKQYKKLLQEPYVKQMIKQYGFQVLRVKYRTHCKLCRTLLDAQPNKPKTYVLWKKEFGVICLTECVKLGIL
jgi:hypothetical protein